MVVPSSRSNDTQRSFDFGCKGNVPRHVARTKSRGKAGNTSAFPPRIGPGRFGLGGPSSAGSVSGSSNRGLDWAITSLTVIKPWRTAWRYAAFSLSGSIARQAALLRSKIASATASTSASNSAVSISSTLYQKVAGPAKKCYAKSYPECPFTFSRCSRFASTTKDKKVEHNPQYDGNGGNHDVCVHGSSTLPFQRCDRNRDGLRHKQVRVAHLHTGRNTSGGPVLNTLDAALFVNVNQFSDFCRPAESFNQFGVWVFLLHPRIKHHV